MNNKKTNCCISLTEDTKDLLNALYKLDDCSTKSIFVEKAIRYYAGYVAANKTSDYLSTAISDSVSMTLSGLENRMAKMLFKYSVEEAIMMNLFAAFNKVDRASLDKLRGQCVEEVKRIKGAFDFSDAVKWQRGSLDK